MADGVEGSARPDGQPKATPEQIERVKALCGELQVSPEMLRDKMLSRAGVNRVRDLSRELCDQLIATLQREQEARAKN
jgi:hypothetical protein